MTHLPNSPEWIWLVAAGMLAAAIVVASYWMAVGRPGWRWRSALIALRWLAIAVVGLCLLDPQRFTQVRNQPKAEFALLLDDSRSMSLQDVPRTRFDAARKWLAEDLLKNCPANAKPSLYSFHDTLRPLPELNTASPTGNVTGLANALQNLLSIPRDQPLAGVVVCSDGIETAGADPMAAAKAYRRKGVPIYTATFGTSLEPKDIVLANVQVKRAVPNASPTRIGLTLRAPGFANQPVQVEIRHGARLLLSREVRLTGAEQKVELEFTPNEKGFQVYDAIISVQPGEWLASNNRRAFGLEVVDPRIQVIYMEGTPEQSQAPIPEWKYLKDALESDANIKVTVLYQLLSGQYSTQSDPDTGAGIYPVNHPTRGFPRTMSELLKYDVIIHSDIKLQCFQPEQLQNMARFVEQHGGGFVMVGGNSAFGKGGYQKTIVDRIIPVAMQQYADSSRTTFQIEVVPAALDHPILAIGRTREDTRRIWTDKFPRLHGFNRVDRAKPGAVVLGVTPSSGGGGGGYGKRIVLAVQEIGKGRSMAFTSDTTRTWGGDFETLWGERINSSMPLVEGNCDSRYYRAFWINAVRWLAAGRLGQTNNPVVLELAQSYSQLNQPTAASVQVRDPEFRPIPGAEVVLTGKIAGTNVLTARATFDPSSMSYRAELRPLLAGTYTVAASATRAGKQLGEDRQLLTCEQNELEMLDVRSRPDLMANIARASGGDVLNPETGDPGTASALFEKLPPSTVSYRRSSLWDNPWWLAAIFGLLASEWVLRRWRGLA